MKRLLITLLLIPSLAFGAFTEFYCTSGGSNINSGSSSSNSAAYTSTNGNWSTTTNQFIPTDGSTPASSVNVGDFASIYIDGATQAVFIARVTVVAAGVNGAITVSTTARTGIAPTTSATARSIKVGGAWKGTAGTVGFPMNNLGSMGPCTNAAGDVVRVNHKNDQTYTYTTGLTFTPNGAVVYQGYTTTPGDGGKATFSTSTNAANITVGANFAGIDLIFVSTAAASSSSLVSLSSQNDSLTRCVVHGSQGNGIQITGQGSLQEVEVYDNNKTNTVNQGGIQYGGTGGFTMSYCYIHDNTGSNTAGVDISGSGGINIQNCILDTNASGGIRIRSGTVFAAQFINNDFYNNTGDAISCASAGDFLSIRNNNFIKNGGAAINMTVAAMGLIQNNGFGSGTQANGSGNTLRGLIDDSSSVTYASGVTPYVAPATGDFRINNAAALAAGRGAFLQTGNSKTGSVGYPDIGAAQSKTGPGGTFSKQTSSGHAH